MAEINWSPDKTVMNDTNIDELDFIGYHETMTVPRLTTVR
jgi:hypothetical protein